MNLTFQTLPGSSFVDDFKLSRDSSMMKAWKERLEPNMEKYKEVTGLGMKRVNA